MAEVITIQKEDKRLIQSAYRKLLRTLKSDIGNEDRANIRQAYELAVQAHSKQRRKSGEPYILHPIAVAIICAEEIGLGPTAIVCALLHDVVEDTEVTLQEISDQFGPRIAKIVDGLTKLDSAYNAESPQAENFKKVLSTLAEDVRVVLIKMADRLHNMRTLGAMPRHKQLKIAAETSFIYAPLAHRLGLFALKTELEDLCFKITNYDTYKEISRKLAETKRSRNRYIKEFIKPIKEELESLGFKSRITGRPKSIFSIYRKIQEKGVTFEEVYDLFAIRIILDVDRKQEKSGCWQVYSLITSKYTPVVERLRDWISTPKANGYESLHTTILGPKGRYVEVQIRSERMDEVAERGVAAHWKYKAKGNVDSSKQDVFEQWLNEIRELLKNDVNAIEFLHDFKTNLFSKEVHVYTPKGDLKILPKGATVLDFAFSIHSEVGYHCVSAKANNRLVPLGYKLKTGDQIQIVTQKNQKPKEGWLKLVTTGKAKSRIRYYLKEEKIKEGEFGKEALERKLNHMKVDFEAGVEFLVKYFKFKSRIDFYYAIAKEQFKLVELKQFEVQGGMLREAKEDEPVEVKEEHLNGKAKKSKKGGTENLKLLINGEDASQYSYTLAPCCNPVPGDEIFGYVSTKAKLRIHRTDCKNATHLIANYIYRTVKAEWVSMYTTSFVAELTIKGIDEIGVVQKITTVITNQLRVNMRSITMDGKEGYYEGKIRVVVYNADQLNFIIKTLKELEGVGNVYRTK
jgi:GTP pyrophosphokinase